MQAPVQWCHETTPLACATCESEPIPACKHNGIECVWAIKNKNVRTIEFSLLGSSRMWSWSWPALFPNYACLKTCTPLYSLTQTHMTAQIHTLVAWDIRSIRTAPLAASDPALQTKVSLTKQRWSFSFSGNCNFPTESKIWSDAAHRLITSMRAGLTR